jgi:hypothetical protein
MIYGRAVAGGSSKDTHTERAILNKVKVFSF